MSEKRKYFFHKLGNFGNIATSSKKLAADTTRNEVDVVNLSPARYIKDISVKVRVTYTEKVEAGSSGIVVHHFHGMGKDTTEISFVSFGDVARQLAEKIEFGKIVEVTGFEVKTSNPRFKRCGNENEVVVSRMSVVKTPSDDGDIPEVPFNFKTLEECLDDTVFKHDEVVDVFAIVMQILESNSDEEPKKVILADTSCTPLYFVLYSKDATKWNIPERSIVEIRNAKVTSYGTNRALCFSQYSGTYLKVLDANCQKGANLLQWYNENKPFEDDVDDNND